jgi:hypothetical protein
MLILFAFIGIYESVQAQVVHTFPVGTTAKKDTITDTGSISKPLAIKKQYSAGSIQAVVTKGTGTVAGTTILQYSVDGVNYKTFNAVGDTLAHTNVATNSKIWPLTTVIYPYYRLVSTGSGTMSALIRGYAYLKN